MTKKLFQNSFLLSVLLHLLLLSIFTVTILQPEEKRKPPNLYLPSYVYTGAMKPTIQQQATKNTQNTERSQSTQNSQRAEKSIPVEKNATSQKSMLAASLDMLKEEQLKAISDRRNAEPILLIGDENEIVDPLIKLLGRALSANFQYPRMAGEFGIRGKVLIELTLHPDGYFTDVQMIRSSNNQDLDAAALYAVNKAPTVVGADRFLKEPKHFVVGFVFY